MEKTGSATEIEWTQVSKAVEGIFQHLEVQRKNGTIKFLKFDPGSSYPVHHHPDRVEWLYVLSGRMIATIDSVEHDLAKGEFATFMVNSNHSLRAGKDGALVLVVAINE
ncbi:MAG: cupin domain-containing protein [Thermoplasmataceae archaeon]